MSQDISERLSKFTPDDSHLDRAALFFAAGRASVRPSRRWPALAAALAAAQVLTLALFWLRPPSLPAPGPQPGPSPQTSTQPPRPAEPSELGVLTQCMLRSDAADLPPPAATDSLVAAEPPLRAFAAAPPLGLD
jgi:hypothetical protein